jgi:transposase InsO family protein
MARKTIRYTQEEKSKHAQAFLSSGLGRVEYCQREKISLASLARWLKGMSGGSKGKRTKGRVHRGPHGPEVRARTVESFQQSGLSQADFCRSWGISPKTFSKWVLIHEKRGRNALMGRDIKENPKKRGRKGAPEVLKDEIARVKMANPDYGIRKVRDFLRRFGGVKVSAGTVNKTLKEKKLDGVKVVKRRRRAPDRPRRFERALPMQLWQSDITSFVLPRISQRCYLVVFMDDCSRYIVSWSLELRQTTDFVMQAMLSGMDRFGRPEEVLTDQGRQYFSWRGKNEFQKLLKKKGVKHVVSRSHHPETLGKCERFWETIQKELWELVMPRNLEEAQARIGHYINHYNHFRTHQGMDGMVPADRFFGLESEVRKALEKSFTDNELRMSLGESPRTPVFLVGQIGGQAISMHGESGNLRVQLSDGSERNINYEEFGHGKDNQGRIEGKSGRPQDQAQEGTGPADQASGSGEGPVGSGQCRGEAEGAGSGHGAVGVLDGTSEQGRDGHEAGGAALEGMADVPAGDLGNAGGSVGAAEEVEKGGRNGSDRKSRSWKGLWRRRTS